MLKDHTHTIQQLYSNAQYNIVTNNNKELRAEVAVCVRTLCYAAILRGACADVWLQRQFKSSCSYNTIHLQSKYDR